MNVFINLASESGMTGLTVDIISDALTAEVLESLGIGLEAHMDLVNPASDKWTKDSTRWDSRPKMKSSVRKPCNSTYPSS